MTWSMFAINFLDIGMKDKADQYFAKGYREYIRPEFKVCTFNMLLGKAAKGYYPFPLKLST